MPGLHPGLAHLICLTRDHFVESGKKQDKNKPRGWGAGAQDLRQVCGAPEPEHAAKPHGS